MNKYVRDESAHLYVIGNVRYAFCFAYTTPSPAHLFLPFHLLYTFSNTTFKFHG